MRLARTDDDPINKRPATSKLGIIVVVSWLCFLLWVADQQITSFKFKSKAEEIFDSGSLHWENIHIITQWRGELK